MLHCVGEDGIELFNTFEFKNEGDKKKLEVVLKKFDAHCSPGNNTLFERCKFWNCSQQEGETADQFVTELKKIIKNCDFTESTDAKVRERFEFGTTV